MLQGPQKLDGSGTSNPNIGISGFGVSGIVLGLRFRASLGFRVSGPRMGLGLGFRIQVHLSGSSKTY